MGRRFDCSIVRLVAFICLLSNLSGCKNSDKHYVLHGRVMGRNSTSGELIVDHEEIPGFMMAMTMPYPIRNPNALNGVEIGDKITADVVVQDDRTYWLENIVVIDKSGRGSIPSTTPHELSMGEQVPDVPLVNQDGKTLHLSQFKGKTLLLTFIYTRCPFPNFCPLISSKFSTIHKELAGDPSARERSHLLSISLDPSYDVPPVLRKYGLAYLGDDASGFEQWDFVSTSVEDLQKLATAFGLQYFEQNHQISHSLSTILIAPDGKVAKSWAGNDWKTTEVVSALRQVAVTN